MTAPAILRLRNSRQIWRNAVFPVTGNALRMARERGKHAVRFKFVTERAIRPEAGLRIDRSPTM